MDISSLLVGAAFALLGVCRLAPADRGSWASLAALPGIGMVVTGAGLMVAALLGPLPEHPTVGAVGMLAIMGVGLILLVARPTLSRLGRSRWFRYHAGSISRQKAASHE